MGKEEEIAIWNFFMCVECAGELTFKEVEGEEKEEGVLNDLVNTNNDACGVQAELTTEAARIHDEMSLCFSHPRNFHFDFPLMLTIRQSHDRENNFEDALKLSDINCAIILIFCGAENKFKVHFCIHTISEKCNELVSVEKVESEMISSWRIENFLHS